MVHQNFKAATPSLIFFPKMVTYLKEQQVVIRVDIAQHSFKVVHLQDGQYHLIYKLRVRHKQKISKYQLIISNMHIIFEVFLDLVKR